MTTSTKRYVAGGLALAIALFEAAVQTGLLPVAAPWTHFALASLGILAGALPSFIPDAPTVAPPRALGPLTVVALLAAVLLGACAHATGGHYAYRAPDPAACALAVAAAGSAQLPCDRRRPDPGECAAGILRAVAALAPCAPVPVWVDDPPPARADAATSD